MFRRNRKARKPFWWWLLMGAFVGGTVVLFGIGWKRVKNKAHIRAEEEEVPQPAEATTAEEENQG